MQLLDSRYLFVKKNVKYRIEYDVESAYGWKLIKH